MNQLKATAPNIIQSAQKDDHYIHSINSQLQELTQYKNLRLSMFVYGLLTSILGNGSTLGEEACDLIQVKSNKRASVLVRLSSIQVIQ